MTLDEIKEALKNVLKPKRYKHSINVMEVSVKLAEKYGEDSVKAAYAGLLHDCAKEIKGSKVLELCKTYGIPVDAIEKQQPELLHGPLGARLAKEIYGIDDNAVLSAIRSHTTGSAHMELLDKIVYIADYIEPGRDFPGVEDARKLAFENIEKAVLLSLNQTVRHVIARGWLLHPETVNARNALLMEHFGEGGSSIK